MYHLLVLLLLFVLLSVSSAGKNIYVCKTFRCVYSAYKVLLLVSSLQARRHMGLQLRLSNRPCLVSLASAQLAHPSCLHSFSTVLLHVIFGWSKRRVSNNDCMVAMEWQPEGKFYCVKQLFLFLEFILYFVNWTSQIIIF